MTKAASDDKKPRLEQAAGAPLRWLTRFSGSELAERLRLREPAEKLIYRGVKNGVRAAADAARVFQPAVKKLTRPARLDRPAAPERFDLNPTDEQQMVRDTMRRFADEIVRPAAEHADAACATPPEILQQACELGVALLAVPEALGGAAEERSVTSTMLIAEELSRGDMGIALACMAPLGVIHALVDWGTAEQQSTYLPAFAGDSFVPAALALLEPQPLFDPMELRAGAVRDDRGGWALHGTKSLVPLGQTAELFLVAAAIPGVGPRLFLVPRGTEGLVVEPEPAMGVRAAALSRLKLDGVHLPADALLGGPETELDFAAVVDRARVAWCALAVGTAQAVLDYVIPYTNDRQAFGEPISHRQSVAFMVADIAIELEGMRLLTWQAAARADRGASIRREALLARAQCARLGMKIGSDGVQLLGGHGFVKDHPVERWYRNLRAAGVMEGALLA